MNPDFQRVKALFLTAAEKRTPADRQEFLDKACGGDESLRAQVAVLLNAHEDADSFLKPLAIPTATVDDSSRVSERPGTVIGPYKLLQEIGEGGMGTVFLAEQTEPVRRKVALKIIKPGLDSAQVIARFEAERQALALMDHPNIARVLDAGETPPAHAGGSQRPYFVMELVKGASIITYCDESRLTPRERLELFIPVCHAIQHAHQKGIIHRDIKPSNVLVAIYDGKPVPKVIDFGIAKATDQPLTEKTLFTRHGQIVGTFEYMSPEQATLDALDVDTRSDVYSLGVLLYELLTGTTPLNKDRLQGVALLEMLRLIREEEPPRPSTRLSASGDALTAYAVERRTESQKLPKLVRGELDWIAMKALEKARARRYDSANALAADVQRYLNDEQVEACPPSLTYRLQKFARKHKTAFAMAGMAAALLLFGIAATSWQAVRATQAEGKAITELENAEKARNGEAQQRAIAVAAAAEAKENARNANANAAQAEKSEQEANKQRDEAQALNEKLRAAQGQLRGTLYAAHMNLAQNAWEASGVGRVREFLERHRPKPGESDLRGFEWYYLYRLSHAELLTLKGHTGKILSVAYSPDGKRLVSASADQTVKVWDAQTGQELVTVKGFFNNGVRSVEFSADGKRLASAGGGSGVKVWDAQTGQELLTLKGHIWDPNIVAFSLDGKRLATASLDQRVKVWDAQTGQELLTIKAHTGGLGGVNSLAFSPDGKRLAITSSGPGKGELKVWDAQAGLELLTLNATSQFRSVAFSPDGKRVATSSGYPGGRPARPDEEVKVWDAQTGRELFTLMATGRFIAGNVAFSPDGKRLASAGGGEVRVWDAQTSQELLTLKGIGIGDKMAFSPDGERLASISKDNTVTVWDAQNLKEVQHPKGPNGYPAFSPAGMRLATVSSDNSVKVWNAQAGREQLTFKGEGRRVTKLTFSPDGKHLAIARFGEIGPAEVKVWDAQTAQELSALKGLTGSVYGLVFSPDGKHVATRESSGRGEDSSTVKVWDAQTGQELFAVKGLMGRGLGTLAFSPNGKRLASGSMDSSYNRTIKVWDAQTGQELFTVKGIIGAFGSAVFNPDGKRLVSRPGDTNGPVKVWDAQTGQELLTLKWHTGTANCMAFSPDGTRLASADQTVQVWDAQTGQELLTLEGHTDGVYSVVFSPDGKRLASASADRTVKVWDAQAGGQDLLTLKGHSGNLTFSPDGRWLVSCVSDGTVKIWDATPLPEKR